MSKKILIIALAFSMACLVSFDVSSASCDAGDLDQLHAAHQQQLKVPSLAAEVAQPMKRVSRVGKVIMRVAILVQESLLQLVSQIRKFNFWSRNSAPKFLYFNYEK